MTQEAPKITFPCDYSLRIVGDAGEDFRELMLSVVRRHVGDIDETTVQIAPSSKGNFASLRLTIVATGEDQLQQLFVDLRATGRVHMVI